MNPETVVREDRTAQDAGPMGLEEVRGASSAMRRSAGNGAALQRYYQFHSRIYDITRWTFLFGRQAILDRIAAEHPTPRRILEVGCGTGRNLVNLCRRFPHAEITGLDLSAEMLDIARGKVRPFGSRAQLLLRAYNAPLNHEQGGFDVILFSYALSMFNPGFQSAIDAACADLAPGALVAVVDFHDSRFPWFERWMGINHVRMDGHLLPILRSMYEPRTERLLPAYWGVWRYVMFTGLRRPG